MRKDSPRGHIAKSYQWPALIAGLFLSRLYLIWMSNAIPPYFYCDSASHLVIGLLTFKGILPWSWHFFPLQGALYTLGIKAGADILYAPFLINGCLAAICLCSLYDGTRRLAGSAAAGLAAILVVSLPAFTRLIFSADQEMTAMALCGMAFWCFCRGLPCGQRRKFLWHMAAIGVLGLALDARSECAGLLVLCAVAVAFSWRRRPACAAALLGGASFWIFLRAPGLLTHVHRAQRDNASGLASLDLFHRVGMFPRSLIEDWPLDLLFLFGFGSFSVGTGAPLAAPLFCIMSLQGLLLWGSSVSFGASFGEPERNLCLILAGLAVPAAVVISDRMSRLTRRSAEIVGVLLLVLLSASWKISVGQKPCVPPRIEQSRLLGWKLRQLAAHGRLGGPNILVLFEALDRDWANAVVFSGLQDRWRMIAHEELDSGASFIWDEKEPVGIAAIRLDSTLRDLNKKLRVGELLAIEGPFKIYETAPRASE
jgi:hypothetical protein